MRPEVGLWLQALLKMPPESKAKGPSEGPKTGTKRCVCVRACVLPSQYMLMVLSFYRKFL